MENPALKSQEGEEIYLLSEASRRTMRYTQHPVFYSIVKQARCDAYHFPHLLRRVRMLGAIFSVPLYAFLAGIRIVIPSNPAPNFVKTNKSFSCHRLTLGRTWPTHKDFFFLFFFNSYRTLNSGICDNHTPVGYSDVG